MAYMTPSEYAADEIAAWQRALEEQRYAESALAAARRGRKHELILELLPQVHSLRTKADLLLADAVTLMCLFRDARVPGELGGPEDSDG